MNNDTNRTQQDPQNNDRKNAGSDQTLKNPFKETAATEPTETPEEEAAAEQQRKEALTERD